MQRSRGQDPAAGRWLLPPGLVTLGGLAAVFLVPREARAAVLWCAALAALSVAAVSGETIRRGRRIARLEERLERQLADTELVAYEQLPVALEKLKQGRLEEDVMPPADPESSSDPRLAKAHRSMLYAILDVLREKEYQRDSAKRAIVNIACRIQSEIHRLQDDIVKMEFRHDTPDVLSDLMHLEHGINVTGRFATALAVVGGGAPVRRWERPITLYDVMRAGSGPITEYLRVQQHRVIDVAIAGQAAESVIMLFAELLDNATRYSPPGSSVVMNTEEVALGIEVSIEDKGTGLTDESRRRAEFLLQQGVDGLDLEDLGETARIGLRVAGILASHWGIRISLRPSTCGGVRAVVFLPNELIVHVPPPPYKLPPLRPTPNWPRRPVGPEGEAGGDRGDESAEGRAYERTAGGLPQRRRRRGTGAAPAEGPLPTRPAHEEPRSGHGELAPPGMWVDAFFAGLRGDRAEAEDGEYPAYPGHQGTRPGRGARPGPAGFAGRGEYGEPAGGPEPEDDGEDAG
ncbi:ATP-binding protein [Streptomyces hoynatensis]|uniref:histidine kinase n=1 Tax=Streptomyces hoynatensis TaxID=1141874 RepID=A0A3A9ZC96_9ACTN|nr:ATP-binding protein [Streptomyces hoynatensis]RKN45941.1 ATP-binding protein [Streptomyces hoynatensis]